MKHKFSCLAISYLLSLVCFPCDLCADNRSDFGTREGKDKTASQVELIDSLPENIEENDTPDLVREIREAYEEELLKTLAPFKDVSILLHIAFIFSCNVLFFIS